MFIAILLHSLLIHFDYFHPLSLVYIAINIVVQFMEQYDCFPPAQNIPSLTQYLNPYQTDYLINNYCSQFQPIRQFFVNQPVAQIVKSCPTYKQTLSKHYRNNLKIDRQIKYLRGVINNQDYLQSVKQYLNDQYYQSIQKKGNTSLENDGILYWSFQDKLYSLPIQQVLKRDKASSNVWSVQMSRGKVVINLQEIILELKNQKDFFIIARSARRLAFYNIKEQKITENYQFQEEIIGFWIYDYGIKSKIYVTTYDGNRNSIKLVDRNTGEVKSLENSFPNCIHSGWNMTEYESVVCNWGEISLFDQRVKQFISLYKSSERNRIFTGISLNSLSFSPNYIASSESFSINLYDLRNSSKSLKNMPHYCEESPPSILQLFQLQNMAHLLQPSNNLSKLIEELTNDNKQIRRPILIAHSPYTLGSSLFAQLFVQDSEGVKKYDNTQRNRYNKLQLLFDKGKMRSGYHSFSITPIKLQDQLGFFHFDNFGGMCFQLFEKRLIMTKNSKVPMTSAYQRVDFYRQQGLETLQNPNIQWFQNHTIQKNINRSIQDEWQSKLIDEQMDIQLQQKTFEKRYLRFADLKQFYHKLNEESSQETVQRNIKSEQIQMKELIKNVQSSLNFKQISLLSTINNTIEESRPPLFPRKNYISNHMIQELNSCWQNE